MSNAEFRRVIYSSDARGKGTAFDNLTAILIQSRFNNGLDGISGLLWTDGARYIQLLEGPPESVALTLERILRDQRHANVAIISDRMAEERAFGDWAMANLPGDRTGDTGERLNGLLAGAPADVCKVFADLH